MEKIFRLSRHEYTNLPPTDIPASEESYHALEEKQFELFQQRQHRRLVQVNRVLVASTIALVITSLWLSWELHTAKFGPAGSFKYGFKYELGKNPICLPRISPRELTICPVRCRSCARQNSSQLPIKPLYSIADESLTEAAKKVIELEEYKFLGSPAFLDDGTEFVPEPTPGPLKTLGVTDMYVGEPSKALDWNWNQLHWGKCSTSWNLLFSQFTWYK